MHRISLITELYEVAKKERQNGNESMTIAPYYIGIKSNGNIIESNTLTIALADNPIYIIGWTVHHYQKYGSRKDGRIFCFVDNDRAHSGIHLGRWSLTEMFTFQLDLIEGATIKLIDTNDTFTFRGQPINVLNKMSVLWKFIQELDLNCKTVKEAEFYHKYYVAKLELDQASLSIDEYKEQLKEKASIISQYEELMAKIDAKLEI